METTDAFGRIIPATEADLRAVIKSAMATNSDMREQKKEGAGGTPDMVRLREAIDKLEKKFDGKKLGDEIKELTEQVEEAGKLHREHTETLKKSVKANEKLSVSCDNLAQVMTQGVEIKMPKFTSLENAMGTLGGRLESLTSAVASLEASIKSVTKGGSIEVQGSANSSVAIKVSPTISIDFNEAKKQFDQETAKLTDYLSKKGGKGSRWEHDVQVEAHLIHEKTGVRDELKNYFDAEAKLRKPTEVSVPLSLNAAVTAGDFSQAMDQSRQVAQTAMQPLMQGPPVEAGIPIMVSPAEVKASDDFGSKVGERLGQIKDELVNALKTTPMTVDVPVNLTPSSVDVPVNLTPSSGSGFTSSAATSLSAINIPSTAVTVGKGTVKFTTVEVPNTITIPELTLKTDKLKLDGDPTVTGGVAGGGGKKGCCKEIVSWLRRIASLLKGGGKEKKEKSSLFSWLTGKGKKKDESGGGRGTAPGGGFGGSGNNNRDMDEYLRYQRLLQVEQALQEISGHARNIANDLLGADPWTVISKGAIKDEAQYMRDLYQTLNIQEGLTTQEKTMQAQWRDISDRLADVKDTGQDITTIQGNYVKLLQRGIKLEKGAYQINKGALNISNALGIKAEEMVDFYGTLNQEMGFSVQMLNQYSRGLQDVARTSGLTGDNLMRAVKNSEQFVKSMRDAGTLTAESARNAAALSAASQTRGVTEPANKIMAAISSREGYQNADRQTYALVSVAAGRMGMAADLIDGSIMGDPAKLKKFTEGLESMFGEIISGVTGRADLNSLRAIQNDTTLTQQQKAMMIANANEALMRALGVGIGQTARVVDTFREASMSWIEKLDKQTDSRVQSERRLADIRASGYARTEAGMIEEKKLLEAIQKARREEGNIILDQTMNLGSRLSDAVNTQGMTLDQALSTTFGGMRDGLGWTADATEQFRRMGIETRTATGAMRSQAEVMAEVLDKSAQQLHAGLKSAGQDADAVFAELGITQGLRDQAKTDPRALTTLQGALEQAQQRLRTANRANSDPMSQVNQELKELNAMLRKFTGGALFKFIDYFGKLGVEVLAVLAMIPVLLHGLTMVTRWMKLLTGETHLGVVSLGTFGGLLNWLLTPLKSFGLLIGMAVTGIAAFVSSIMALPSRLGGIPSAFKGFSEGISFVTRDLREGLGIAMSKWGPVFGNMLADVVEGLFASFNKLNPFKYFGGGAGAAKGAAAVSSEGNSLSKLFKRVADSFNWLLSWLSYFGKGIDRAAQYVINGIMGFGSRIARFMMDYIMTPIAKGLYNYFLWPLGKAMDFITKPLQWLFQPLGQGIAKAVGRIGQLGEGLEYLMLGLRFSGDTLKATWPALAGRFLKIFEEIGILFKTNILKGPLLKPLADGFAALFGKMFGGMPSFGDMFGKMFGGMKSILGPVGKAFSRLLAVLGPLTTVIGGITGMMEAESVGRGKVEGLVLGLLTGGAKTGSMFSGMLGLDKGSAADEMLGVAGAAAQTAAAFSILTPVLGPIAPLLGAIVGAVAELYKIATAADSKLGAPIRALWEQVKGAFNDIKDAAIRFYEGVVPTFKTIFAEFVAIITGAQNGINGLGKALSDAGITAALTAMGVYVRMAGRAVAKFIDDFKPVFIDGLMTAWKVIKPAVQGIVQVISSIFAAFQGWMSGDTSELGSNIGKALAGLGKVLVAGIAVYLSIFQSILLGWVGKVFNWLGEKVGGKLGQALGGIGGFLTNFAKLCIETYNAIQGLLSGESFDSTKITEAVWGMLKGVGDAVAGIGGWVGEFLKDLPKWLDKGIAALADRFGEDWVKPFERLSTLVKPIIQGFQLVFQGVAEIAEAFMEGNLTKGLKGLWKVALGLVEIIIMDLLIGLLELPVILVAAFGDWIAKLGGPFARLWDMLEPIVAGFEYLFKGMVDLFDGLANFDLGKIGSGLLTMTQGIVQILVQGTIAAFIGWEAYVAQFLGDILYAVGDWLGGGLGSVLKGLGGVIMGTADAFAGLVQILSGIIFFDWGRIKKGFGLIWDGLGQVVKGLWNFVKGIPWMLWDMMVGLGEMMWEGMKYIGKAIWSFIWDTDWKGLGKNIANSVVGLFKTINWTEVGRSIGNWAKNVGTWFSDLGVAIAKWFKEDFPEWLKKTFTKDNLMMVGKVFLIILLAIPVILLGAVGIVIMVISRVIEGLFEAIGEMFTDLINWAPGWLRPLFVWFQSIFKGISDVFGGIADIIEGIFSWDMSKIGGGFMRMLGGIWDMTIGGMIKAIVGWFEWLSNILVDNSIIPDMVVKIIWWFLKLPITIAKLLGKLLLSLADSLTTFVVDGLFGEGTWQGIKGNFVAGWNSLKEGASKGWEAIKNTASAGWRFLKGEMSWNDFIAETKKAFEPLLNWATGIAEEIGNALDGAAAWAIDGLFGEGTWDKVKEAFNEGMEELGRGAEVAWEGMQGTWSAGWALLNGEIDWDEFVNKAKESWGPFVEWAGEMGDKIMKGLDKAMESGVDGIFGEGTWEGVKQWFSDGWEGVLEWASTLWSDFLGIFSLGWDDIVNWASGAWDSLPSLSDITDMITGIPDAVGGAFESVIGFFKNIGKWVAEKLNLGEVAENIGGMVGNMTGLVRRGWNSVMSAPGRLWAGLVDMWGDFKAWAADMLEAPFGNLIDKLEAFELPSFSMRVPDGFTTTDIDLGIKTISLPTGLSMRTVTIGGGTPFSGVKRAVRDTLGRDLSTGSTHRTARRAEAASAVATDSFAGRAAASVTDDSYRPLMDRIREGGNTEGARKKIADDQMARIRPLLEAAIRRGDTTTAQALTRELGQWQRALDELGTDIRRGVLPTAQAAEDAVALSARLYTGRMATGDQQWTAQAQARTKTQIADLVWNSMSDADRGNIDRSRTARTAVWNYRTWDEMTMDQTARELVNITDATARAARGQRVLADLQTELQRAATTGNRIQYLEVQERIQAAQFALEQAQQEAAAREALKNNTSNAAALLSGVLNRTQDRNRVNQRSLDSVLRMSDQPAMLAAYNTRRTQSGTLENVLTGTDRAARVTRYDTDMARLTTALGNARTDDDVRRIWQEIATLEFAFRQSRNDSADYSGLMSRSTQETGAAQTATRQRARQALWNARGNQTESDIVGNVWGSISWADRNAAWTNGDLSAAFRENDATRRNQMLAPLLAAARRDAASATTPEQYETAMRRLSLVQTTGDRAGRMTDFASRFRGGNATQRAGIMGELWNIMPEELMPSQIERVGRLSADSMNIHAYQQDGLPSVNTQLATAQEGLRTGNFAERYRTARNSEERQRVMTEWANAYKTVEELSRAATALSQAAERQRWNAEYEANIQREFGVSVAEFEAALENMDSEEAWAAYNFVAPTPFMTGAERVSREGLAYIHKGESIIPADATGPFDETIWTSVAESFSGMVSLVRGMIASQQGDATSPMPNDMLGMLGLWANRAEGAPPITTVSPANTVPGGDISVTPVPPTHVGKTIASILKMDRVGSEPEKTEVVSEDLGDIAGNTEETAARLAQAVNLLAQLVGLMAQGDGGGKDGSDDGANKILGKVVAPSMLNTKWPAGRFESGSAVRFKK